MVFAVSARECPKVPMLPGRILICAGENRYILFTTSCVNRIYEGRSVICVKLFPLRPCPLEFETSGVDALDTFIERDSSRHGPKIYPCSLRRTYLPQGIHVYTITRPLTVLPSVYYHVYNGLDVEMRWHVVSQAQPQARDPQPQQQNQRIPGHVLKRYIDSLICAKESCPITLEEFSLGNITVTGCGHAFEKGSLDSVSACPICRANLVKEDFLSI